MNQDRQLQVSPRFNVAFGVVSAAAAAALLSACGANMPEVGGGSKSAVTGAVGGETTANANTALEHCDQTLGTIGVVEDQNARWYYRLRDYKLGSTVPVLRMMIQQSNCFVVVERGRGMNTMMMERSLEKTGEMRAGSNFQAGQMVAADYTLSPEINFSQNTGGMSGGLVNWNRSLAALGSLAGGIKTSEASTTLMMIDNRSGVQLAAAEGTAKNTDFNVFGSTFGWAGGAAAGGYSNTPEGKIIIAAFADSYNQLVKAVRNYKAHTVKGGLGTGGALGVQGGSTGATSNIDTGSSSPAAAAAKKAPAKARAASKGASSAN